MNKLIWRVFLSTLLFVSLFVAGCQKEMIDEINSDPQVQRIAKGDKSVEKELLFLRDVEGQDLSYYDYGGVTESELDDFKGGVYIIGGDMIIRRRDIQERMRIYYKEQSNVGNQRHRKVTTLATSGSKLINIVNTNPPLPTSWSTAIAQARTEWNNLGQGLTFTVQAGNGTDVVGAINVRYTNFTTNPQFAGSKYAIATAYPPVSGAVQNMYINSYYNAGGYTASQKKFIVAHELAHTIGFAHTDTYEYNAIDNVPALTNCRDNPDLNSVWRPGSTPVPSWTGFSSCDVTVFGYYYWSKLV